MRLFQFVLFAFLTVPTVSSASDWGADGLIDLMSAAPVHAGGEATSLSVVAMTASGEPLSGLKIRVTPSQGRATQPRMERPGLYMFSYTPPSSPTSDQVVFELTGRTADKRTLEASASLALQGSGGGRVSMAAEPGSLVLGKDGASTLSVASSLGDGQLDLQASSGSIADLLPVGEGMYKARYEPPDVTYPHVALLTAVGQAGAEDRVSGLAIPLAGATDYPLQGQPGATLQLRVGDRVFGPVKASATGAATVPVEVPAGVSSATLIRFVDNQRTEEEMLLGLPEASRIRLFQLPSSLPSSLGGWDVHAFVVHPDGTPDTGAAVEFSAAAGSVSAPSHIGDGLYRATWTLPAEAGRVRLTASIAGEGSQSHSWTVQVDPALPEGSSLELSSDPEATRALVVTAKAQGSHGIDLVASGAVRKGPTVDRGDGVYQATFGASSDEQVYVRALPRHMPSANDVAGLSMFPMVNHVASDTEVRFDVISTDRFGAPVAHVDVTLEVAAGGGQVPASIKTDANGLAHFMYRSGGTAGVARVIARAGSVQGGGVVLQQPSGTAPDLSGVSSSSWAGLFPVLTIGDEPAPVAAASPALAAPVAAAPAAASLAQSLPLGKEGDALVAIELTTVPAWAIAGEEVELTVLGLSSGKQRIPGLTFDLLVAGAKAGDLVESAPGTYKATLYVPRKLEGPVKVSAVAGGKMAFLEIPKGVAPPKVKPVKEPKVAKTSSGSAPSFLGPSYDPAWLLARFSGALSLYSYEQMPTAESGPLLNQGMAVTGANRAVPMGVALHAEAWNPDMEMLGARVKIRATRYAISASIFEGQAPDWLVDVSTELLGRYLVDVPFGRVWAGGHAGLRYDDFMLFTGCLEPGCSVGFEALPMAGMGLGLDAGAEMGSTRVTASFTQGLARFSVPHASSFDLHAMYRLDEQWFVDVGGSSISRSVVLRGADSGLDRGTIDDHQLVFEAGMGIAF